MKHLSLGFAFGLMSSSIGVLANSPVYLNTKASPVTSQPPVVSLNTFSTWMAHLMGTSDTHSVFYWKDTHRQEALEGVQALWTNPALKSLASADPFDDLTNNKKPMIIIGGVDQPEALLPDQTPSFYVEDNNAQDFTTVALDTMTHYADKLNVETQKIVNVLASMDTKMEQVIDSFKTYYESLVDTNVFDATNKADQTFMAEMEKARAGDFDVVELTGLDCLAKEHGTQSTVYKEAQRVVSQWLSELQDHTLVMTPYTHSINKRALPVTKIDAVSDFQLLFWTGVFLVLVTAGVLTFVYQLGYADSGNTVFASTVLPKQD
ncbi:hypothetical protein BC941DRAFT_467977 [Chlamydoabsidia padenii]|nr:hypothetical protein BC941DRAFT_467977 [Chlamydoabsidia padenii]